MLRLKNTLYSYDSLFNKQFSWWPRLDGLSFDSIGEDDTIWLERAFEEDEVFEVVKALNSDKGPDLDNFIMVFF
jgi:hypothetical protein